MTAEAQLKNEEHFVTVSGVTTHYTEKGHGPAALFMHGASLGSSFITA